MSRSFRLQATILLFTFLLSSCGISSHLKNHFMGGGRNENSSFYKIKNGMTHAQVLKIPGIKVLDQLQISQDNFLYKFDEGFIVEENGVVTAGYEYPLIQPGDTVQNLVGLGMTIVETFESAGWPLSISTKNNAHVLYYRTGTLLVKDNEILNSFNRNDNYNISVNSYKGTEIKNPVYYLEPSIAGMDRNSLEFLEVKNYVEYLISLSGGKFTDDLNKANVILYVNFGVGDKQVDILTYSRPIYRSVYTPGNTTTSNVTNRYGQNLGTVQTTSPGSYSSQYAGQHTSQYQVETYRRHLILEAVHASSLKTQNQKKYFWKTTTLSEGSSGDFRAILPVLTYGTQGYFFKNSGKAVLIRIHFEQMMNFFLEIFSR